MSQSVMQFNQDSSSFELTQDNEYQQQKVDGFKGTFEEYLSYRDYTKEE